MFLSKGSLVVTISFLCKYAMDFGFLTKIRYLVKVDNDMLHLEMNLSDG